jgi:protoporphyrinogen oxidase
MKPFNEKLFGVPMSEIGTEWCSDIPVPDLDTVVRGATMEYTSKLKGNAKFGYPKKGGMQAIVDALVKKLAGRAKIITGRSVCHIDLEKKGVLHRDAFGVLAEASYDILLSTVPLCTTLQFISPNNGARDIVRDMRSTVTACLMLGFQKPLAADMPHWIYAPEAEFPFYRIACNDTYCPSTVPAGCGNLSVEITIKPGEDVSEKVLLEKTLAGLRKMGLWNSLNGLIMHHVEYLVPSYVIYNQARGLALLRKQNLEEKMVYCFGRFGEWGYSSVGKDMTNARNLAHRLKGAAC